MSKEKVHAFSHSHPPCGSQDYQVASVCLSVQTYLLQFFGGKVLGPYIFTLDPLYIYIYAEQTKDIFSS